MVSQKVFNKLKLSTEKHSILYNISSFKQSNEVLITRKALIPFSIGGRYYKDVWCDVVSRMLVAYFWVG